MPGEPATDEDAAASLRWWFLPSWLGLDAPCVTLTWTWAIARSSGEELPARPAIALFMVVWAIYLSDRLLDVASCPDWTSATGRLRFGKRRRPLFLACLVGCLAGLAAVLWAGLPPDVIGRAMAVAVGVGVHFLAFVRPVFFRAKLPGKEFGVGLFFAMGAFACLGATAETLPMLLSVALVVAFNCLVIAARDADSDAVNDPGGATSWWHTIDRDLLPAGIALTASATAASFLLAGPAFYVALAAAFGALTTLHRRAPKLSGDAVRALADFALLTPIPVLAILID